MITIITKLIAIMPDMTIKLLITSLALSMILSPLGCFAMWNRIVFSGETIAHTALLGISLALLLHVPTILGIILFAVFIAVILWSQKNVKQISQDTWLAIIMYGALALGYIVVKISPTKINPEQVLWGDILLIQNYEIYILLFTGIVIACIFAKLWKSILTSAIHEELAFAEQIITPAKKLFVLITFALGLSIVINHLGVLLSPAMLIIPTAAAALLSHSPKQMVFIAFGINFLSNICGISLSFLTNWPTSPSIVVTAFIIMILTLLLHRIIRCKN